MEKLVAEFLAAAPLGQPGVYQATTSTDNLGRKVKDSLLSNSVSAGIAEYGVGPLVINLAGRVTSWHWLNIAVTGSQPGVRASLSRLLNQPASNVSIARRMATGRLSDWRSFADVRGDYDDLADRLARRGVGVTGWSIGIHTARRVWGVGPRYLTVGDFVAGAGADLVVGGFLQGINDAINYPGLWTNDPGLAIRRVGAAGFANATTGILGTATAGISLGGVSAVFSWTPPVLVVIGTGIVATVIWDIAIGEPVGTFWFTIFDANIDSDAQRGLAPLN